MTIIAKTPRWGPIVLVAVVLYVAVQLAIQWRQSRPAPAADLGPGVTAADTADSDPGSTDRLISRALGQIPPAPPDSTEIKTGWRDEVRGIDLDALSPRQREVFLTVANAESCTCGCGYTLAACRENDLTCPVSLPCVEALRDSVLAGQVRSIVGLRRRPDRGVDARSSGD